MTEEEIKARRITLEITLEDIEKRMTALKKEDWDEIDERVKSFTIRTRYSPVKSRYTCYRVYVSIPKKKPEKMGDLIPSTFLIH